MALFNEYPYTNFHEMNLDWVIAKIKELAEEFVKTDTKVTNLETDVIRLKQYVDDYFKELDIHSEVLTVLEEMEASGELGEVLLEATKVMPFCESFDANRLFRDFVYANETRCPWYAEGVATPNRMQGGAFDGSFYYIAYWDNNSDRTANDYNKLVKYDSIGNIVGQISFTAGWCNGLAVDEDTVYICVRGDHTGHVNTILKYNKFNLSALGSVSSLQHFKSLYYANETMYAMDENNIIYIVDKVNFNIQGIYQDAIGVSSKIQNFAVEGHNIYYITSAPDGIIVYNKYAESYKTFNAVDRFDGRFIPGELQWISVANDIVKFGGTVNIGYLGFLQNIFETNLFNGIALNHQHSSYYGNVRHIYCNSSSTGPNPDGSSDNPYKYELEAVACAGDSAEIELTGTFRTLYVGGLKYAYIHGAGTYNYGAFIKECSFVTISNTSMNFTSGYSSDACIVINNSDVNIRCNSINTDKDYAVKSAASKVNIVTSEMINNNVYSQNSQFTCNLPIKIENVAGGKNYNYVPLVMNSSKLYGDLDVLDSDSLRTAIIKNCMFYIKYYGASSTRLTSAVFLPGNYMKINDAVSTSAPRIRFATATINISESGITINGNTFIQITASAVTGSSADASTEWSDNNYIHITEIGAIL